MKLFLESCILNAQSCKKSILLFRFLLWNIHPHIHTLSKLGCYKCFRHWFFFLQAHLWSNCWYCIESLNCFFQRLLLWSSKRSFDPKIIPSSFILFSLVMVLLLILPRKMSFLVLRYMTFSTIYFHVYKMNNYWGF